MSRLAAARTMAAGADADRRAHPGAVGEEGGFGVEICQESEKKGKECRRKADTRGGLN